MKALYIVDYSIGDQKFRISTASLNYLDKRLRSLPDDAVITRHRVQLEDLFVEHVYNDEEVVEI